MGKLFLLFTLVPLLELYCLFWIGRILGPLPTFTLVIVTGFLGAWFARLEGFRVLRQWQKSLIKGQIPSNAVFEGLMVLVGGILLVTPGILTDALGLSFLIPWTRKKLIKVMKKYAQWKIANGTPRSIRVTHHHATTEDNFQKHEPHEQIIDVEGEVISDEEN